MSTNDQIRHKIFDIYSSNIKLICAKQDAHIGYENDNKEFIEPEQVYVCPICSKLFIKESLDQKGENPLTLEDVPPKSLGGKPLLLTCKNCNNKLGGSKLDSQLKWNIEVEPFFKHEPNSRIRAYYELNKRTKVKGSLVYIDKNKYGFHFNPNSNPNLNEEMDFILKNWNQTSIRFTFQAPNQKKVLLALLRIAHLKMFSVFGYGYYFNPSIQIISKQLFDPSLDLIPKFGIPLFDTLPPEKIGIHFVKSPRELSSFLVVFNIKIDGKTKAYAVLIPGPKDDCINLYTTFQEHKTFKLDLFPIPDVNYLNNPAKIFAYREIWENNFE